MGSNTGYGYLLREISSNKKEQGGRCAKEDLGKSFKGIIVTDGWKVYLKFTDKIQRCWAHILREARFIAEIQECHPKIKILAF